MAMIKRTFLLLVLWFILGTMGACYTPLVPQTVPVANAFVADYCACFDQYKACTDATCVTDLWEDMHTPNTIVIEDGEQYGNWRDWNKQVANALRFLDPARSVLSDCVGGQYSLNPPSMVINTTHDLTFVLSTPFSFELSTKLVRVISSVELTFFPNGKFKKKVYTSDGGAMRIILDSLMNMGSSAMSAMVPDQVTQNFFRDTPAGVVVFLGTVILVMYLTFMVVIYKISMMCIKHTDCCKSRSKTSTKYNPVVAGSESDVEVALNE